MLVLAIWTLFTLSVQDTIPPVLPDFIPEAAVQDTIPPAVPDSLKPFWQEMMPLVFPYTIPPDSGQYAVPLVLPDSLEFTRQDTTPPVVSDTLSPFWQEMMPLVFPYTIPPDSAQYTVPLVLPDSIQALIPPAGAGGQSFGQGGPEEVVTDTVEIWNYPEPEGFEIGETDSTLRWKNVLNLADRFHQKRGVITGRTGTVGRLDAIALHTFESRHLSLEMEGMNLNQPLTGSVDWNRLPVHKISEFHEAEYGSTYRSEVRLRDYYLTEPRTYLNFDESKFNYRSLEFTAIRNFTQRTNAEISFWDRRDGGGYTASEVEGRQIVAKVYHQLTDNWLLKTGYINNGMDRAESFGYDITDPQFYHFNRFVASPVESSASSNQTSSDLFVQAHYRKDKSEDVSSELGLHYQTDQWSLSYSADTVATHFKKIEGYARQHLDIGSTRLRGTGRLFYLNEAEKENLQETQWLGGQAVVNLTQPFTSWSRLHGMASATAWNDGRVSTEISGKLEVNLFRNTTAALFGGILSKDPDIQSLYWLANEYEGNPNLQNEEAITAGAMIEINLGNYFRIGARGDYRDTQNGLFTDSDSTFINLAPYSHLSGTGWIGLDSDMFEGEISAVYKKFNPTGTTLTDERLNVSGDRTWVKGHLYWKNYLFNRATYVTAGVSGVFSPNAFRTTEFIPELNRWQHGTNQYINPAYYRMDLDISARIRWFMVLIKWENILDRVGQAGYFESTGYPMPERRFTMGLRILFTN